MNQTIITICQLDHLLQKLFQNMDFCQHDSDYRITRTDNNIDELKRIRNEIVNIIKEQSWITHLIYIYSTNYYHLTQYSYQQPDRTNFYAAKTFRLVDKDTLDNYCRKYGLDTKNYIISPNNLLIDFDNNNDFETYMDSITKKYQYKLPTRIEFEPTSKYPEPDDHCKILQSFKFIDVLKLRDAVSLK